MIGLYSKRINNRQSSQYIGQIAIYYFREKKRVGEEWKN